MAHILSTYKDGYRQVSFCKLCGKEDNELIATDCPGKIVSVVCQKELTEPRNKTK